MHAQRRRLPEPPNVRASTIATIGMTNAAAIMREPHPPSGDAHARHIRSGGEILGTHATRLRALERCGKPS